MNDEKNIARYWEKGSGDNVVCFLCPRQCRLKEGQRGFCFVRQNIEGALVLTTYGRSSGFCVDPIEKKPLYQFYPGTGVLSFGTVGCNLGCKFCQNWDISKAKNSDRLAKAASPALIAKAAQKFNCKSVAFTYNEPVIYAEYAIDVAKECHALGIKTVAVTAGYVQGQAREDFFEHMDAANVDLKGFSEKFYKNLALGSLQPVLDTLMFIRRHTQTWLELTTLLIPGENDSEDEIHRLSAWVSKELGAGTPLHLTAFHPDFKLTDHPATPTATLRKAREIALAKGLQYVYTGNVYDPQGSSTFCVNCRRAVIEREGFEIRAFHLKENACVFCGTVCDGYFDAQVGTWGSRCLPINL